MILYDRLIPAAALDGARADAELLFVGKEGGGPSVPQEQTEALMIERARAGRTVVRLKGGDPFVFGRGGEEALALRAAGIAFEVVPGVTAGVAASAYAGIPVTHRGLASAVALVTGQPRGPKDADEERDRLARAGGVSGTLVFYMGVRRLPEIAASLIAAGRPRSRAGRRRGSAARCPRQRTVTGTLETIAEVARRGAAPRAVDHGRGPGRRAGRGARLAGAAAARAGTPSRSRARARRRAASRGGWRRWARASCRRR